MRFGMNFRFGFICFLFILLFGRLWSQEATPEPRHLTATAKAGDGVITFLAKYEVNTPCNRAYFYKINQLSRNKGLRLNKSYHLPILVYVYNGRSIRSTIGIDDFELATRIQHYNERMHRAGLKGVDYRQDRVLWVPYSALACPQEIQQVPDPPKVVRGTFDIFGEYAEVMQESRQLEGCVYYLVSGHGGRDPGAVGRYGRRNLCEDEYAYDICLRIGHKLMSHGATVYFIVRDPDDGIRDDSFLPCDKDEFYWGDSLISDSQSRRLEQRSNIVNTLYEQNKRKGVQYQRLIVIHIDSDKKQERVDMFFYHQEANEASKSLAGHMQQVVRQKYAIVQKGRGYRGFVRSRDLHMLRESLPPTVFIELGNIKNPGDQLRFIRLKNRELISDWLFEGLLRDRITR